MNTNLELQKKLVIGISSRALFDLDESNLIFEKEGQQAYEKYQISKENEALLPGVAFALVKKLLALHIENIPLVEVILLSRNSSDTGLRIFNSIKHHDLNITRAVFTGGRSPYEYVSAFGTHLFLSANSIDVKHALDAHCAAATIISGNALENSDHLLRIAFDGDAVLFSDESEKIFHEKGLVHFQENEKNSAKKPLSAGPFKGFLTALHHIQTQFPQNCPIRTALVTARSAPAHERVIHTLRAWKIRIDEALFLGGLSKGEFLKAFGADFFFDDQRTHCEIAGSYVPTGHVPHGVKNET